MRDRERFVKACGKMGCAYISSDRFIIDAMGWLATKIGDIHIEYHKDEGWQISSCLADDGWDDWISDDDGSLVGALLLTVEKVDK